MGKATGLVHVIDEKLRCADYIGIYIYEYTGDHEVAMDALIKNLQLSRWLTPRDYYTFTENDKI